MTLLGQTLMPRLDAEAFAVDTPYRERIIRLVRENKAGGFCMFGRNAEPVADAVRSLQAVAIGAPALVFSADCEFGLPMRFECGTEFPDAMAIAKAGDSELARKVGQAIAKEMRALGLSWNFAPVADVNSNPENPIINTRAFGDDPDTVSQFSVPFMYGLQSVHVIATAKHFPGHGDTSVDSHRTLPFIEGGLSRFEKTELPPFRKLISAGVQSIMTGHLATPTLSDDLGADIGERDLPATLSSVLTTQLLRDRLGFGGVIVTDAMEMRAIRNTFGDDEAVIRALLAGADIVLMPPNPEAAYDTILQAAKDGRISRDRIRSTIQRLMKLKEFAAVGSPDPDSLRVLEGQHKPLALEIAQKAIENTGNIELSGSSLVIITEGSKGVIRKAELLSSTLSNLFDSIQFIQIGEARIPEIDDHTVLAVFYRARGYVDATATDWTIPRMMREFGAKLELRGSQLAGLVLFGNPYLDRHFAPSPRFIVKTFSESTASVEAASHFLINRYNAR